MKTRKRVLLCLMCALLIAPLAHSAYVGDSVPPLVVSTWVKNPEAVIFDDQKITLLEFWTTWCPYCVQSIPELTNLQAQYRGQVRVVAVTNEELSVVSPFVNSPYRNLGYSVGIVDDQMLDDYQIGGYPTTLIVDQGGRVAWRGYSSGISAGLAQAVAGGVFFKKGLAPGFLSEGDDFTFSVEMANANPVTYSWTHNDAPVGGNSPTLTLSNVTVADAGLYVCTARKVSDPQISTRSTRYLVVVPAGESVPAASVWSIALVAGMLAACGAVIRIRKPRGTSN